MKKQIKIKIVILLAAFVAALVGTFTSMFYQEAEPAMTTMKAAVLPVVYMRTEGGYLINPAYGYLSKVNGAELFNGITPLDENRNVTAVIYNYGKKITGVSYQVRDIETGSLLEDTKAVPDDGKAGYVTAEFNIKHLIEKDKQYLLKVVVSTEDCEAVEYYQRILWADNLNVDGKLDFVMKFHGLTYDKERLSEIVQWIETDSTGDNTNYGSVNIHSTAEQIGWGDLDAMVEGEVTPVLLELNSSVAQISLHYRVAAPNEEGTYDSYQTRDYYRIRQAGEDKFYLLSYVREADQDFDGNEDLQASGRINLGIKSSHKGCVAMSDEAGNFSYFADSGQLWCYDRKSNKFTNVFSFRGADIGFRGMNNDHDIKLVAVNKKGDADFLLYGYMNGGEHEGQTGVSLYHYVYEENIVREAIFIPIDLSYEVLRKNVGDIAYIADDQFYIKLGTVLYSIDLSSMEMMVMSDGLYEGTYAVNEDGTRLAYHYSHSLNDEKSIRVLDFREGTESIVEASQYGRKSEDNRIKVIGYIENDLVFGIGDKDDRAVVDGVNEMFPMYGVYIVNEEYSLVKDYKEKDIYVTNAAIDGMRVNLTRVAVGEDGKLVATSIDQLMNRKENNAKSGMYTETVTTKLRQKELYLYLPSSAGKTDSVSLRYAREIIYDEENSYVLTDGVKVQEGYFAFGYGKCLGFFENIAGAVKEASQREGFVIGQDGSYLWHRTQQLNTIVWNDMYAELSVGDFGINLTGLSLSNILYFLSTGKLVLARSQDEGYAILYDYDNSNVYYYEKNTGEIVTKAREDAENLFVEWGNVFLTN